MLKITSKIVLNEATVRASNLTDKLTSEELDSLGEYCWKGWDTDCKSREVWMRRNNAAMDLAMQIQKEKTFPWPNASNIIFPLVSIASLQFSARAYGNLILAPDLVNYIVLVGDVDEETRKRAERLSRHMSFQLLEQDTAWEEQHDRLFINLSIVGTAFIKSRYDGIRRHNVGELVLARDLVVNYWSKDLTSAPRITQEIEMSRNIAISMIREGAMRDVEKEDWFKNPPPMNKDNSEQDRRRGMDPNFQPDFDTPLQFLEQHRNIDLDCDGYAEPYIVTLDRYSRKVVRLVFNCDRVEDIERNRTNQIVSIRKTEYYTKYSFIPAPDGGFYDVGFGTLMGPLNEGVNTAINQLFDAGTVQNLGGGWLGRGAKMQGGIQGFVPGEWKKVDSTGDDLRKSMVPNPAVEPSPVLFQLLGLLIEYTNLLAGSTDTVLGKNPGQNTPAETSRNMTESGLQIYSTIFKRIWRSMKEEFRKYHILNRSRLPDVTTFGAGRFTIKREDYRMNPDWVRPAADPNIVSAAQRFQQALSVREAAMTSNGGYDLEAVERNFLKALRVQNLEEVFPGFGKVPPSQDPKIEIERLRAEVEQADQQLNQWQFIKEWQEAIRLNTSRIHLLEAQTAKIISEIEETRRASVLESLQTFIAALKDQNTMLTDRVKSTLDIMNRQEKRRDKDGKSGKSGTGGGGTSNPEANASRGSALPSARQSSGGDAGAVGLGLPGGFKN